MELKTERCTVRRFAEKDINDFMHYRNDEHWMKYQGWFKGLTKEEYVKELLANHPLTKGSQFAIISNSTNRLIGDVYLKQDNAAFWIGYTISPLYARQGYVYEVISAIILWIKQQGYSEIKAGVLPDNIASINLLQKLKFNYTYLDDFGQQIYILHLQD